LTCSWIQKLEKKNNEKCGGNKQTGCQKAVKEDEDGPITEIAERTVVGKRASMGWTKRRQSHKNLRQAWIKEKLEAKLHQGRRYGLPE